MSAFVKLIDELVSFILTYYSLWCNWYFRDKELIVVLLAVFARMSQPSQPVRCSKKAVIRHDDFVASPGEESFRYSLFLL